MCPIFMPTGSEFLVFDLIARKIEAYARGYTKFWWFTVKFTLTN